ncbi:hypothetical protein ES703_86189 [subsurface metagenome]|jgi:hypothetical protein
MNPHLDMFGYLMSITILGGRITMEDGFGIRSAAGLGFPMRAGDGASAITAGGTGGLALGGTGFRPVLGVLLGFTGTVAMTTMDGALSVIER